jgi:hypothetical protein
MHEARHSDCTGGISNNDLAILRASHNTRETDRTFNNRACGHMHTYCPAGHTFEKYLACDDRPWGAYAIQYVYLRALLTTYQGADRAIMDASVVDTRSRLLMDVGSMGRPDMSSAGLQ